MLKLSEPRLCESVFRRELPELDFLSAPGETTWLEFTLRAGGWVNPDWVRGMERTDRLRKERDMRLELEAEAARERRDREHWRARARLESDLTSRIGREHIEATYDACVVSWRTSILNDGGPMTCDREHFLLLSAVEVPEISRAIVDMCRHVTEMGRFQAAADEAIEKN